MRRLLLLSVLAGLMGSSWADRPIVARTLESKLYSTGDAVLVIEVAEGVIPDDLLGKTIVYERPGASGQAQARIYLAQRSGRHIKVLVSIQNGGTPGNGGGAVIL